MTLDQLDAELRAARASLRRLRDETVAELKAEAEAEANPYTRETLLAAAANVQAIGTQY
ncbi:MAG TPA: hypothetical protein VFM54_22855 [Micromonosporaceae bacterium]|nr:hypothetical protein [Micromonosporaceae bacterium]